MIPQVLIQLLIDNAVIKATVSKPRIKGQDLKNVYIKRAILGKTEKYSCTYRYATKDQAKNYSPEAVVAELESLLTEHFYNLDIFTVDTSYTILQSKKGKIKLIKRKLKKSTDPTPAPHDHQKKRTVTSDRPWLADLGITSSNGKVYASAQSKFRQINRYVELVSHLLPSDISSIAIADMGSGKGYLTFALHDYLQTMGVSVNTVGIEMRPDLIDICNKISSKHDMGALAFVEGSIDTVDIGTKDMVIALHACDIATDMAIAQAIRAKANYIVLAPCCHKQIRKTMQPDSVAVSMLKHGILLEREAEMITDAIRAMILESRGYKTRIIEWISSEHTGKNIMITAVKTGLDRPEVLLEIDALKSRYGIDQHYLEKILP